MESITMTTKRPTATPFGVRTRVRGTTVSASGVAVLGSAHTGFGAVDFGTTEFGTTGYVRPIVTSRPTTCDVARAFGRPPV